MTTATPAEPAREELATTESVPLPPDPKAEIDAKKTILVLLVSTIGVFGTVWLLYYVYAAVIFNERVTQIEAIQYEKVQALRAYEAEMLGAGDSPKRVSIEAAIEQLAPR